MHKPAAAFGREGGNVPEYNAGRLTWSAAYDEEACLGDEEYGVENMRLYGPQATAPMTPAMKRTLLVGAPRGAARVPARARRQIEGVVPQWPAAGDGQAPRERAYKRRAGGVVRQGVTGWPGVLLIVRGHGRDHDARVPALITLCKVHIGRASYGRSMRGARCRLRRRSQGRRQQRRRG